ncbi:methyltransferase [Luedemannella flava]|uniref:Methyltransferase n=1 Tax=Luedemannella flava TaxID=349316 RepID=A0ABN2MLR2_9ACTN
MSTTLGVADFVRAHTTLRPVPGLPSLLLHQADDAIDLWQTTEAHLGATGTPPPFWAFAWAGGHALARYVLEHPDLVAGRGVLDVASGSGLVAVAAAAAGAASVVANEIDGYAAAAIALNADANGFVVDVVHGDLLDGDGGAADVVFAGDVFYSRAMAQRVLAFLERARARGAQVLVGDPGRAYLPRERFTRVADYRVPVDRSLEDADTKDVTVWRVG